MRWTEGLRSAESGCWDGCGGRFCCVGGRKKWDLWDLWDLWEFWENGANEMARGFAKRSKKINTKQRCRRPQTNQLLQQRGQGAAAPKMM